MTARVRAALHWHPARVAALMDSRDITSRAELAKRLPRTLRASVYRSFDADWAGTVHVPLLVHIAIALDAPAGRLFLDPRGRR